MCHLSVCLQSLLPRYPCKEVPARGKSYQPLASACHWTRARTTWGRRQMISTLTSTTSTLLMRGITSTTRTMKWTGKVGRPEYKPCQITNIVPSLYWKMYIFVLSLMLCVFILQPTKDNEFKSLFLLF